MELIHIGSTTLVLLFLFLLLLKKEKNRPDFILIGWFSLLLLTTVVFYKISLKDLSSPWLLDLVDSGSFLHAPLLWMYTKSLIQKNWKFKSKYFWHFLPFIIAAFFLILPSMQTIEEAYNVRSLFALLKFIQVPVYLWINLKIIQQYQSQLPQLFSYFEKIELDWLKLLSWGLLIIWGISLISIGLHEFTSYTIPAFGGLYGNFVSSLFILILGYFGFRQPAIFANIPDNWSQHTSSSQIIPNTKEASLLTQQKAPIKYAKTGLSKEGSSKIYESLLVLMKADAPYLNPKLSLFQLAKAMSIQPNQLSQVINTHSKQNFFDFINQYRVEAVKTRIKNNDYEKYTLLSISMDCGFNSKASFNRAFKKHCGMTPSAYRKQIEKP